MPQLWHTVGALIVSILLLKLHLALSRALAIPHTCSAAQCTCSAKLLTSATACTLDSSTASPAVIQLLCCLPSDHLPDAKASCVPSVLACSKGRCFFLRSLQGPCSDFAGTLYHPMCAASTQDRAHVQQHILLLPSSRRHAFTKCTSCAMQACTSHLKNARIRCGQGGSWLAQAAVGAQQG